MPYKKTYRKRSPYATKKRYAKKRTTYRKRKAYSRQKPIEKDFIMPDSIYRRLGYVRNSTYNGTGPIQIVRSWRMNSLYDPDVSIGGDQPVGYSRFCPTFYQRYLASRFKVSGFITNQSAGQRAIIVAFVFTTVSSPAYASPQEIQSQPHVKWFYLAPPTTTPGTFPQKRFTTGWISIPRILGRKLDTSSDDAVYNVNPSQELYCHMYMATLDGSTGAGYLNGFYSVKVNYGAKFFEPTPITLP